MIKGLVSKLAVGALLTVPMCGGSSGGGTQVEVRGYVTVNGSPSNRQFTIVVHDNQLGTNVQVQSTALAGWSTMLRLNDTFTAQAVNLPGGCVSNTELGTAGRYTLNTIVRVRC